MKKDVSLDSQGVQSSAGFLGNSRLTFASPDTIVGSRSNLDLVDVSIQVDLPVDVIIYDSDDDTMGRKRFSAFRTKKSTPLYSKEDIREQYCITNKQLHVLESAQARKLFGCIPNQDWKSCHRASLLSSCLRKTKSASDENLAGIRTDSKPLAWEPLPPEMQGPSPKAVASGASSSTSPVLALDADGREPLEGQSHHLSQQQLQVPAVQTKSLRQSFDEELANAVLRRKAKLGDATDDDGGQADPKRHTWAEDTPTHQKPKRSDFPSSSSDGNLLARHSARPTLLRLRSQDSASVGSDAACSESQEASKRHSKTLPNTPDLSHGSARRQAKTPDMTLDERRQKHVSFDSAALIRSHPTISNIDDGGHGKVLASPPMRRMASKASPDRKSQERLLDIGSKKSESLGRRLGSIRSLDFTCGLSPKIHQTLLLSKLRKSMKTQATQTEITVAERIAIPAPVLAYLTLSPRAHGQELPTESKVYHNGKKLVKSRSDSEYKLLDESDLKMTVIHLDDSKLLAKRHASRSKSTPIARHVSQSQKEIMVMFKPQEGKNGAGVGRYVGHHHKLLKTFSEGSVLNRQHLAAVVGGAADSPEPEAEEEPPPEELKRERSESDPLLLETDMDQESGIPKGHEQNVETRQRSRSVAQTESEKEALLLISNRRQSSSTSSSSSATSSEAESEEEEEEEEIEPERLDLVGLKDKHSQVSERTSLETTSRDSPKSEYHSITDQSASSTPTPWSGKGKVQDPLASDKHDPLRKQTSDGIISEAARRTDGSLEDGEPEALSRSDRSATVGSLFDADKTITYSSDTEFGSIKSEESHTLMDQREVPQPLAPDVKIVPSERRPKDQATELKVSRLEMHLLSPKEHLTSPESESSEQAVGAARPKSDLSDSTKSEPEGSETSEDYQTATEHSNVDAFEMWAGHRPAGREIASQDGLHNLPSPRSPHTSSLSIESSTSGSYTLESGLSEQDSRDSTRKLSTSTVSDSDKELENIFSSQGEVFVSEQRDNGRGRIERNLAGQRAEADDDDEEEHSLTPTPDVPCRGTFSSKRQRDGGDDVAGRERATSKSDSTTIEELTDKSFSEDVSSRSSEVVQSSYNFAEIRLKFERMLDGKRQVESTRDRSSSMETEGTCSLSDGKPPIRKKPEILTAKPVSYSTEQLLSGGRSDRGPLRPTGFLQKFEREVIAKRSDGDKGSPTSLGFDRHRDIRSELVKYSNSHRKEYRRSVSESPETSSHSLSWDMPRSASEVHVESDYGGLGQRTKRGFSEPIDRPNGKKHKPRILDKDEGHSRLQPDRKTLSSSESSRTSRASSEETSSGGRRSIGKSPERSSGGVPSISSADDTLTSSSTHKPHLYQQHQHHHHHNSHHHHHHHHHHRERSKTIDTLSGSVGISDQSGSSEQISRERKRSSSHTPERELGDRDDSKKAWTRADRGFEWNAVARERGDSRNEKRKSLSSYSFDASDLRDDGRLNHRKRREWSLPGSSEKLEDRKDEALSKSLPDRQMEFYEMSKMLCTECGEKIRKIHGDEGSEGTAWSHDPSEKSDSKMQEATWIGGREIRATPSIPVPKQGSRDNELVLDSESGTAVGKAEGEPGAIKNISGQSSTESLLRRSPGAASIAIDSPGLSSSLTSSLAESSQYASTHDIGAEEEDEDVGVYAESYRASAWIYIGDNEELMVWQGRTQGSTSSESEKLEEDTKLAASSGTRSRSPTPAAGVDPSLHRTDSLESTASEKEFRRKYQAITHRMVHRKSSVEMYKRLSNRTFECDKTVTVQRKSGEFGFRIHGSRPVVISAIEPGTPAESSGLEVGDIVISVNGVNVLDASHSEVVKIAHTGTDTLQLEVARTCHILTPVVSDIESQQPIHCGFLYKLAGSGTSLVKKWCRRWFVLKQDHCLYYYKTDMSKEPLGAVMLLNYSVSRAGDVGRSFAFRVTKYGSASYCFSADSEESMNNWASIINQTANSVGQSDPWIEVSSRNVQLPALSIHTPDCHGYLGKLGQKWRTWKRRYCVLKDACMYFYHDMNSTTALGVAHLHGYRVQSCSVAGKKLSFEAVPAELKMRHFYFYADNDTDRKRWLAAMEYSIDRWIKVG